jgi:hypothetical protein
MIRSTLFITLMALGFSGMDASAAEVQVAYKGVVKQANGPQASAFLPGQEIRIRYTVETSATDTNPDPRKGVYYNTGLRQLHISVPGAGVDVATGIGTVQTFNDVGSDQAFFYSTTDVSGQLSGLPVNFAEVDFVDFQSVMLASDAIPTTHLMPPESFFQLGTSAGYTSVIFLAEADEPLTTCASEGYTGTQLNWCVKICESGLTGKALDDWIHRWIRRYHDLPYCAAKK